MISPRGEFTITDPKSLWVGRTLYDLYEEAHTPAEWHKPIADRAKEHGLLFMSTPFPEDAVDLPAFDLQAGLTDFRRTGE